MDKYRVYHSFALKIKTDLKRNSDWQPDVLPVFARITYCTCLSHIAPVCEVQYKPHISLSSFCSLNEI